jgi:hypothetical protein
VTLYKAKLEQSIFCSTFFNTIICWVGTNLSEECTASILKAKSAKLGSGWLYKKSKKIAMESRSDQLVMDGEEDMMHGWVCSNC